MKNLITLVLVMVVGMFALNAQNLSLKHNGRQLTNGETITMYVDSNLSADISLVLLNNSENTIDVIVSRDVVEHVQNSELGYCFGVNCYTAAAAQSAPFTLAGNDSTSSFHTEYLPMNTIGTTIVKYTFFEKENESNKIEFVAKFVSTCVGVKEHSSSVLSFSNAYPNPATSIVSFDYKLSADSNNSKLVITDMLGSIVAIKEINNTNGKISVDISSLNTGVYFYSLNVNGTTRLTKKLIVK